MPKFSIIIPVYNVEKYIKECLDSVLNQTYKDYEVIVVNDGTKDNSIEIAKEYPFKIINQKNQGLSVARNTGVKHAKGEYILFLDSDDYLEKDTLKEIEKSLDNTPDIVRFQIKEVFENKEDKEHPEASFINKDGIESFEEIVKYHFIENAWCYAINRKYYNKHKFQFRPGTVHEDFGLIPLVIINAKIVSSIDYIGYNYRQRQGSIMNDKSYEKIKKQVSDFYNHYLYLRKEIEKVKGNTRVFKSYIANSMLKKICELSKEDYKEYKKKLKKECVTKDLLTDTLPRKIKKRIVSISPKLYYK